MLPRTTEGVDKDPPVRDLFRSRSLVSKVREELRKPDNQKWGFIGLGVVGALLVFLLGFAVGGGFADDPVTAASGGVLISEAEAELRLQEAAELQQAESRLVVAQGEAAFMRSTIGALTADVQAVQRAFDQAQVEMEIIIAIYEECLQQRYPVECVTSARPRAEAFLEDLYSTGP